METADLIKSLASQGVFALLFGYLGHRQLRQYDRLQEQNDKMVQALFEVNAKTVKVLDGLLTRLERLDK